MLIQGRWFHGKEREGNWSRKMVVGGLYNITRKRRRGKGMDGVQQKMLLTHLPIQIILQCCTLTMPHRKLQWNFFVCCHLAAHSILFSALNYFLRCWKITSFRKFIHRFPRNLNVSAKKCSLKPSKRFPSYHGYLDNRLYNVSLKKSYSGNNAFVLFSLPIFLWIKIPIKNSLELLRRT
jgi:hypothetical protein